MATFLEIWPTVRWLWVKSTQVWMFAGGGGGTVTLVVPFFNQLVAACLESSGCRSTLLPPSTLVTKAAGSKRAG